MSASEDAPAGGALPPRDGAARDDAPLAATGGMPDHAARVALIREHLPPEALDPAQFPDLPPMLHHAARPEARVSRLAARLDTSAEDLAPFWAWLWPGGAGLLHYLVDHPGIARGRRVIDFGAGSGLVAIAAMKLGAARALCVDPDPMARAACAANAALNGVEVETSAGIAPAALPDADLLLAGDVFYDPDVAAPAVAILTAARRRGMTALVSDVGRHCLPEQGLSRLASYQARDVGDAPSSPPWTVTVHEWLDQVASVPPLR